MEAISALGSEYQLLGQNGLKDRTGLLEYPEVQSALSKYPLLWMIEEAVKCGLKVDRRTVNQLGWGRQRKNSPFSYVKPDFMADPRNPDSAAWQPHNSMNAAWRMLEYLPKKNKYKEWKARRSFLGCYIPNAEPRVIPEDAFIHESAIAKIANDPNYKPVNIPRKYHTIPMLAAPVEPTADADDEDDA
ncbi:MAG TPA: hypothetical protein VK678_13000, partial [Bradyrhizobium sp.]|nr:hypothetical protein [Bradyrhizobium sp.]